jgi:hypothetical protein
VDELCDEFSAGELELLNHAMVHFPVHRVKVLFIPSVVFTEVSNCGWSCRSFPEVGCILGCDVCMADP